MIRASTLSVFLIIVSLSTARADSVCAPFYDGLDSLGTVAGAGGTASGTIAFVDGVVETAASFTGSGSIAYVDPLSQSPRGTVSLWIKKTSMDASGGILQLGRLGDLNSMGLFYNYTDTLYFEARNGSGGWEAISMGDALTMDSFTHVVATWDNKGSGLLMKLFVNGRYVDYRWMSGAYYHNGNGLDIGVAGVGDWYGYGDVAIDELLLFDRPLLDSEIYAEYVHTGGLYAYSPTPKPVSTGPVQVVNKVLVVEGKPFRARGVGYQPMPIGVPISRAALDYIYTDPCILDRDIPLLRDMNVNVIRTWSQLPDSDVLLDTLYNSGVDPIYVVMGFWVPLWDGYDYSDPANIQALEDDFRDLVARFKNHPAVLGWGIGNENNLAYNGSLVDWYSLANRLAEVAYIEEGSSYHPTIVINGGLLDFGTTEFGSDDFSLPFVDMWGHNAYFGYENHCYFDYFNRISAKPILITEYGIDAFNMNAGVEYQPLHADWIVRQWQDIRIKSVGGTVMAYSDEWWKAGSPDTQDDGGYYTDQHPDGYSNEEWWGLVAVSMNVGACDTVSPRLAYYALQEEFAEEVRADGDFDDDGDVDLQDYHSFAACYTGPDGGGLSEGCEAGDFDADGDIDCSDWEVFTYVWTGEGQPRALAQCFTPVPAMSEWGLAVMCLALLTVGSARLRISASDLT